MTFENAMVSRCNSYHNFRKHLLECPVGVYYFCSKVIDITMKNLKDILSEGVLGDTDDILRAGDKFVNQEERDKIKAELAVRSWYAITSDEMFNRIVDSCEQLNDADKKGSRWTLIIPDETSTFKPIFVNLAKGVYRFTKRADKELYGTTVSAMHKRIVKEVKTYKDEGLSTGWITNKSISFLAFLMNEYTRVNSISGNNWYTISIKVQPPNS